MKQIQKQRERYLTFLRCIKNNNYSQLFIGLLFLKALFPYFVYLIIFESAFLINGMMAYGIGRKQPVLPIPGYLVQDELERRTMTDILLLGGVFLIAVLYSSVGHGGASGYLAFMALLGFAPEIMRPAALVLNIFVSAVAFVSFARNGHFKFKLLWPFIITSIPFAFLGGSFHIDSRIYKIILGLFLLFAILRMLLQVKDKRASLKTLSTPLAMLIGAILGFLSGLIGIGGGIILSPIVIILGWASVKQTAAVSAAFILLNSLAGFSGFILKNDLPDMQILYLVLAALFGGLLGSYLGSFRIKEIYLRYTLALVLLTASVKLFIF